MKNRKLVAIIILLVFSKINSFGQAPDIIWTKKYGGIENDAGYWVQQTTDGGYIITGYTNSYGDPDGDVWIIKTDSFGDTIWTKVYGYVKKDIGYCVQQTNGGYIIAGTYGPFTGGPGQGLTDVWLLKMDFKGDTTWTKLFTGNLEEEGYVVRETSDGGYIIVGYTRSYGVGDDDVWLIKTDINGNIIWTKTYGGFGLELGKDVQETSDGGYIIVAETGGNQGIWLIKTDEVGNSLWTKNYGGYFAYPYSIVQTSDGGYIILGEITLTHTQTWLIKTNSNGDTLWTKTFDGIRGFSMAQTSDGGFIISGGAQGDLGILRINSFGDTLWAKSVGSTGNDIGYSVQQTFNGGYIIVGSTYSNETLDDIWLIRLDSDVVGIDRNEIVYLNFYNLSQNYPNPFNPNTTIRYSIPNQSKVIIKVYDILGNEIKTLVNEEKQMGSYELEFDASTLTSGIYFYQLKADNYIETKKMILLK